MSKTQRTPALADLTERTVKHLRNAAEGFGITYAEAKKANGGKTPTKETWISLIKTHPQYAAPTQEEKVAEKAPIEKAVKKTEKALSERKAWTPPETENAAQLCRAGLLAAVPDFQIREVIAGTYPSYGALKICCTVYRRELKARGELK